MIRNAPELAGLFPTSVLAARVDPRTVTGESLPEEMAFVSGAADVRRREFVAGRLASHSLLRRLNCKIRPILVGRGRAPVFPSGIVGSISHLEDDCRVVMARDTAIASLGLDLVYAQPLEQASWATVLTRTERARLEGLAPADRGMAAILTFSAKESVYKCLYPLSGRWLDFQDVEIEFDPRRRRFKAILQQPSNHAFPGSTLSEGRYRNEGDRIATGLTISLT